jgi:hypothetical protein
VLRNSHYSCFICSAENYSEIAYATISPWLREITELKDKTSLLVSCPKCFGSSFTVRYSNLEMDKLYSNYRDLNYTKKRNYWEPWYTQQINDGHDDKEYISVRKEFIQEFLIDNFKSLPKLVIDIGGDRGQYIPDFLNTAEKYVLEASEKELIPGTKRISNLDNLGRIDLIIYAHILEHLPSPLSELKKLIGRTAFLYIEVPDGIPEINRIRQSYLLNKIVGMAATKPFFWRRITKPGTGRKLQSKVLRQSEHLSFFSAKTFEVLALELNVHCIIKQQRIPNPEGDNINVLQVLFSHKKEIRETLNGSKPL